MKWAPDYTQSQNQGVPLCTISVEMFPTSVAACAQFFLQPPHENLHLFLCLYIALFFSYGNTQTIGLQRPFWQVLLVQRTALPEIGSPELLSDARLVMQRQAESVEERTAAVLSQQIDPRQGRLVRSPVFEELAFVEDALAECRAALETNERHGRLRERVLDLARRRVDLLRRLQEEAQG